jgi:hypothetical protein
MLRFEDDTRERRMGMRIDWTRRLAGVLLGCGLLAVVLVAWRLFSDAATLFAPLLALVGIGGLGVAHALRARLQTLGCLALRTAGWGAIGLAIAASFSLGVFLPTGVAAWIGPALGRFGGPPALLLCAIALLVVGVLRRPRYPDDRALDLATFLAVSAFWLQAQLARQISFPQPPTVPSILETRLTALAWLAVGLAAAALVLRWNERSRPTGKHPWTLIARSYGRWLWRWGAVVTALGVLLTVAFGPGDWARFLPAIALLLFATPLLGLQLLNVTTHLRGTLRNVGALLLAILALTLVYVATSEDLEAIFARNTLERSALLFWESALGNQRGVTTAAGSLAGSVRDDAGRPIAGATVVVADILGQPYSAVSDADGRYRIAVVPAGNYLPLATGPAYRQGGREGLSGRVATVRAGQTAEDVDFRLNPRPAYDPAANDSLQLGEQSELTVEGLETSTVLRRPFTFANRGKVLDGGIVHEPLPGTGQGPFPILLIVYPGEAASWEGVSVPLAARGHVVVSYFPRRLLDLDGDMDDLRVLLNLAASGQFSARGDGSRIVLVGGSVSTIYTYQLAKTFAGQAFAANVPAMIQYGGLFDFFTFRHSYETGQVTIDPGISEFEYLIAALGRPDTRPEIYLRLSPRYDLGSDPLSQVPRLPPTLLVHAEKDIIVPVDQSRLAAEGFSAAGIPHQFLNYPDLEHYLDISKRDPAQLDMLERTIAFLQVWTDPRRARP